jgi:hypothetical protein
LSIKKPSTLLYWVFFPYDIGNSIKSSCNES